MTTYKSMTSEELNNRLNILRNRYFHIVHLSQEYVFDFQSRNIQDSPGAIKLNLYCNLMTWLQNEIAIVFDLTQAKNC